MANQIAYESITVSTAAIGPTAATVTARVRSALFFVADNAVRHRADGTAPTASVGLPIEAGGYIIISGEGSIRNAQFIRRDGSDATLHCVYYDDVLDVREIDPLGSSSKTVAVTGNVGVTSASALDVSAATVPVSSASALDVSSATVTIQGAAAHDAGVSGNPVYLGGLHEAVDVASQAAVSTGDLRALTTSAKGQLRVNWIAGHDHGLSDGAGTSWVSYYHDEADVARTLTIGSQLVAKAPDGNLDLVRTAGDTDLKGMGALMTSPTGHQWTRVTADAQVLANAGKLHTVTILGVSTAGVITLYDNPAKAGNIIMVYDAAITKVPVTLHFDVTCESGLYVGDDGTVEFEMTVSTAD